ncbi:Uncharacterized protein OBRU01_09853 [Operophtera brumata]|uniref:FLYWCH-type domain-containing protein n=1 Tax=Operophtera brumata TaxID=104452 RepID=A0A0L7LEP7_OPEBR|nr:Uncharacterized protein OBRU01_09853 [Operophtera brumata]
MFCCFVFCKSRFDFNKQLQIRSNEIQNGTYFLLTLSYVLNSSGKQLAMRMGYTFYLARRTKTTDKWHCTSWSRCRANFILYQADGSTKLAALEHNHAPPNFQIVNVIFATKKNGKPIAICQGYTFYCARQTGSYYTWRCTGNKCKGRFQASIDGVVKTAKLEHFHTPPKFIVCDGVYLKC